MTYYANDLDTPFYQPHDLPATTATDPPSVSSIMNSASLSSTALLPREIVSGILVSNGTSTRNVVIFHRPIITQISSIVSILTSETVLVCAGHGFDSAAIGIIATIVIPSVIGLILWVGNFIPLHAVFLVHPTVRDFIFYLHSSCSPY
jgi:hypothetical protein